MKQREKTPASEAETEAGEEARGVDETSDQTDAPSAIQRKQPEQDLGLISDLLSIPEIAAYAKRIGARSRSLGKLVVEEKRGHYRLTLAEIVFDAAGIITAPKDYAPADEEREAIRAAWGRYRFPEYQPFLFTAPGSPPRHKRVPWTMADEKDVAICRDETGKFVLCVEERRDREDGGKDIFLWTYWSDGLWRIAEPPDALPLYGLETIKDAALVFVHEGAKAAKAVQRLIAGDGWCDHPWGAELRGWQLGAVAHVAWLGGALRPEATEFEALRRSGARIMFVADNDRDGIDAVSRISRETKLTMEAVIFNDDWPPHFDLADEFPPDRAKAGTRLADLTVPATWLTEREQTGGRGQPKFRIRRSARADWFYTVAPPLFFHTSYPGRGFSDAELDAMVRPFSDADLTARLFRRHLSARADGIAYLPGSKPLIERNGRRLVNMWTPTRVRERDGSAWLMGRFLAHCFPDRRDRREAVRWGATLAARPAVRMEYAVLLRSETQGIGKTTLANIAAELVGEENVSRPNEVALTDGNFNSHLAKKRLVIVDELYTGHSRKTYNRLKAPITDTKLRVNEKYQPEYEIDNFAHFIFSSNDLVPVFIDASDRRFFMPRMSEKKLPRAFWVRFYAWLASGGLGIILRCSREWVEKHGGVEPGHSAPVTETKLAMIENSISDEMRSVREAVREMVERGTGESPSRIAVTLEEFQKWHCDTCRDRGWKRLTGNRLAEELRRAGMRVRGRDDKLGMDERVVIGGRKMPVAFNFDAEPGADGNDAIRDALRSMDDLGFRGAL